ncbi:MAG: SixA phosphatase family protein [Rubricella sp.]
MKRIVLVRHGKSSWSDPDQDDRERPLNQRGRLAAPLMAAWLADHGIRPDHILTTPALRSQETWEKMAPVFGTGPMPEVSETLYMADPAQHRDTLRALPDGVETVFVIGHQPGLGSFARKIADGSEREAQSRAFTKFPTAAVAVFEGEFEWPDLKFGTLAFRHFVIPKDLV